MNLLVVSILCLFLAILGPSQAKYTNVDYSGATKNPVNYKFGYSVNDPHTGDKKSQFEIRHGDYVKGSYSLHEPDGTIRIVEYTAGPHSGFNAVVKKIGHAKHPQHQQKINYGEYVKL